MPRLPRNLLPDGIFHVTTRGAGGIAIAVDDHDRRLFLRLLASEANAYDWSCHALCLMPNHYHLVVETLLVRLSAGLHRLNGIYAQRFNERHRRLGHLWGDRFGVRVIEDDRYLATACEYVIQNPVRAGLCESAADWRWSASRYGLSSGA
jgi:REP element-mobilizing transposase RayT